MDPQILSNLMEETMKQNIQNIVVGIAVLNGESLLMLQRLPDDSYPNMYEIPGGNLEFPETLEEAIKRELFEETGLKLESIKQYLGFFDYGDGEKRTRQLNFLIMTKDYNITWHPEHQKYAWVDKDIFKELPMTPEMYNVVSTIFNHRR